jgi:hypothetical protein
MGNIRKKIIVNSFWQQHPLLHMENLFWGRILILKILILCMFTLVTVYLNPIRAEARSLEEILASGYIISSLRDRDTVWHSSGPKQLQEEILELFVLYLTDKYQKTIKLEKDIVPDFSDFWKDKSGKVRQGDTYTPAYMDKVDLYADILTINEWREKLVTMISFIPIREVIFCKGAAARDIQDLIDQNLYVYTVKNSSYHTLLETADFPEDKMIFISKTGDILQALYSGKRIACSILDSDGGLYQTKRLSGLKMTGMANKQFSQIGWAASRSSEKLAGEIKDFFKTFMKTEKFHDLFEKQYGLSYNSYLRILATF